MRVRLPIRGGQGLWVPLLLFATASARGMPAAPADVWEPLFQGVDCVALESTEPRPLHAHVLRIDLDAPGVAFMATPRAAVDGGHTYGRKTTTLVRQYGLQAAINAAPFSPVVSAEGRPHAISGLTICAAEEVSPPSGLPALLIGCDNAVVFAEPPFRMRDTCTAVAGFAIILRSGANVGRDDALHPRTAAACSRDGRTLFLMVVDGRQPGYSEGVTTRELADWLLCLGAWDGLNLDGGGTSAMAVEGPDGEPRLLNRPIHAGIPGRERPGPSHLGLWAPRLPDRRGTGGDGENRKGECGIGGNRENRRERRERRGELWETCSAHLCSLCLLSALAPAPHAYTEFFLSSLHTPVLSIGSGSLFQAARALSRVFP